MKNRILDFLLTPASIGPVGPLELLVLQPTPFCNLDCDYCYLPDRGDASRMKPEVIERTFAEVFKSGVVERGFSVVWHAGEPMVVGIPFYEEALRIIDRVNVNRVPVQHSFQTNATLITDAWCEFIKNNGFKIGVSVDGPAEIHDLHRKTRSGHGTHAKVMRGIRLLQKHGIRFTTISVLTNEALDRPDEMYRFFLDGGQGQGQGQGMNSVGFNVEEQEAHHTSSSLSQEGTRERLARFMSRIYDLNVEQGRKINVREFAHFEQGILGWSPLRAKTRRYIGTQENAPFRIISVSFDGYFSTFSPELLGVEVKPYGKFVFGNILLDSLNDAMRSAKFRDAAEAIQEGISECERTCRYYSVCGGGSPANKVFENGTFASTETLHCRLHVQTLAEVVLGKLEGVAAS